MSRKEELRAAEDAAWSELHPLIESLDPDQATHPGYQETWSAKDLMAHVACWTAEATHALQAMRMGTYEPRHMDVDAMNDRFYQACRDLDLDDVRAMLHSSRTMFLDELGRLPEELLDDAAAGWFEENGARHYEEHLPRLREWVRELKGA